MLASPSDEVRRSYIINLNNIHSIGDNTISIKKNVKATNDIPIGKLYKDKLLKELNVVLK